MPEFTELVGTLGPVGAVLVWMWINDRRTKADAPKPDPAASLIAELRSISDRLIRIEENQKHIERILDR